MSDESELRGDGAHEALSAVLVRLDGADAALMGSVMLCHLPPPEQTSVLKRLRPRHYDTGEFILDRGDHDTSGVHTIIHGQAHVYTRGAPAGDEPLAVVQRGELLGEYRAIMGSAGQVDVRAAMPTVTAMLAREEFLDLLDVHPALGNHLLRRMIGTVRRLSGRIDGLQALDRELGNISKELLRTSI